MQAAAIFDAGARFNGKAPVIPPPPPGYLPNAAQVAAMQGQAVSVTRPSPHLYRSLRHQHVILSNNNPFRFSVDVFFSRSLLPKRKIISSVAEKVVATHSGSFAVCGFTKNTDDLRVYKYIHQKAGKPTTKMNEHKKINA